MKEHIEINNYLKGLLSGDELTQFEQKLATNAEFKDEVEMHALANEAVISGAKLNIKKQLQEIHTEQSVSKKSKGVRIALFVGVALITAVVLFFIFDGDSTEETTPPVENNLETTVGSGTKEDVNLDPVDSLNVSSEDKQEKVDLLHTLLLEKIDEEQIVNSDSLIESFGPIEDIIQNPDKYLQQINQQLSDDSLANLNTSVNDSINGLSETDENPCELTGAQKPRYSLTQPVFGKEDSYLEFDIWTTENTAFEEFSIDGGNTFDEESSFEGLRNGSYQIVAKDQNGCLSLPATIKIAYEEKNYVIQPSQFKFWEIEIPDIQELPLDLEIRNARTGFLVYTTRLESSERFTWQGNNQSGSLLPVGNYVYIFSSSEHGLVTKGQITIL